MWDIRVCAQSIESMVGFLNNNYSINHQDCTHDVYNPKSDVLFLSLHTQSHHHDALFGRLRGYYVYIIVSRGYISRIEATNSRLALRKDGERADIGGSAASILSNFTASVFVLSAYSLSLSRWISLAIPLFFFFTSFSRSPPKDASASAREKRPCARVPKVQFLRRRNFESRRGILCVRRCRYILRGEASTLCFYESSGLVIAGFAVNVFLIFIFVVEFFGLRKLQY